MRKYSKKSRERRKEERKDLPEFYQKHIQYIKENNIHCQECSIKLKGDVSEVAHVLPKSLFKSVMTNDNNVLYLCGQWQNNCHGNLDNSSNDKIKEMFIYPLVEEKFLKLENTVTEKINYKIYERYTKGS